MHVFAQWKERASTQTSPVGWMMFLLALGTTAGIIVRGRAMLPRSGQSADPAPPGRTTKPTSAPPAGASKGTAMPTTDHYGPNGIHFSINEADPAITRWLPAITAAMPSAGIPIDFANAWLAIESGGKPCAIGEPGKVGPDGNPLELGLWQAYNPDDLKATGITGADLRAYCTPGSQSLSRAMTDAEIAQHMALGVSVIKSKKQYADHYLAANGVTWNTNTPDYWAMVKAPHAYPPIVNTGLHQVVQKLGRAPKSWQEFRATYELVEPRARYDADRAAKGQEQGPYYRGLQNAEWCGFHVSNPLTVS